MSNDPIDTKSEDIDVSVLIVNYNTEDVLADCLKSVYEKTSGINFEIIVVDNNSRKGSLDAIQKDFPSINVLLLENNLGFGQANNEGAKIARGTYLFILNPDTLLIDNPIEVLFDYMQKNRDVGICGGNMYKIDMSPASSYYDVDFLCLEYRIVFNQKRTVGFNLSGKPKDVNVIVGADLFISKDLFNNFGGFDPDFFMYFEEVELCWRVQKMGYRIVSVPEAEIIHLQGSSAENKSEELGKWSYKEHWYSKLVFFYKTKGKAQTAVVYHISLLKLQLAKILYRVKNDRTKISYWTKKEEIMREIYNRYLQYIENIKVR